MTDEHGAGGHGSVEYERSDVNPASITKAGLIVAGVSTLVGLALIGYIGVLMRQDARRAPQPRALTFDANRQPPLPRLQETPFQDVHTLHREEDVVLTGYGWVDRPAGVVRIPVDDAMALFVKRAAAGQLTVGPAPPKQENAVGGLGGGEVKRSETSLDPEHTTRRASVAPQGPGGATPERREAELRGFGSPKGRSKPPSLNDASQPVGSVSPQARRVPSTGAKR